MSNASSDKVVAEGRLTDPLHQKGFYSKDGTLYIDGYKVLKGWESFTGWYWFATRFVQKQDSDMGDGNVIKDDTIWYGFVQGLEEEWGDFSQGEIERNWQTWPIKKGDLPHAGRRPKEMKEEDKTPAPPPSSEQVTLDQRGVIERAKVQGPVEEF